MQTWLLLLCRKQKLAQTLLIRLNILISLLIAILLIPLKSYAANAIHFNITPQRADKAIIAYAQQASRTIIFSFDLTKKYQANQLIGNYSISEGLDKLLFNTGLIATVNQHGQLCIQLKKINQQQISPLVTAKPLTPSKKQQNNIEKIIITGSRTSRRSADDLPVPVDTLSEQALINTGQTEVGRMLQTIAPSFNFSSSTISDGTDALRPATLRGLGPDQTLVLINGKRRHQASLVHINTSVGRGSTGTDINAIPASAIKRIEILRDGAAAQYGSDAIAGVINIILKNNNKDGNLGISYGQYKKGDGVTTTIDVSKGFNFNQHGFLTTTFNYRDRGFTDRSGLHGSCQYSGCTKLANGNYLLGDPREANITRKTFRIGDAQSTQLALTVNSGYDLGNIGKLYGFITYSNRDNESATFFRHSGDRENNAPLQDGDATVPDGFLPKINTAIKDFSYNIGYKTEFGYDSSLDLSYTYGKNTIDYTTRDTINSSYANSLQYNTTLSADEIRANVPHQAFAYGLELSLQTVNLDYNKIFDNFSLSAGAELRADTYKVIPGDEYSYYDYDTTNGNSLFASDRNPGTQGFGGISAISAVDKSRHVYSLYIDGESEIVDNLVISSALRYDNYQGFGGSTNIKIATNWSVNDNIALRAALSSGFRAPSMQQLYFNNISTQFVSSNTDPSGDQIALQVGTFRNDSALAQAIGIPQLTQEDSTNYSFGSIAKINDNIHVTIDFYKIDIDNRIVLSNKLGEGLSTMLDSALTKSKASAGQFFLNGANTQSKGVDIIATYNNPFFKGDLAMTFAANFTSTEVTKLFAPKNSGLSDISPNKIFSAQDISIIEDWQPKNRISINSLYSQQNWSINVAFNRYGQYTILDGGSQQFSAKILTDLRFNYQLSNKLSFNLGSNNLFDITPDKNKIGNSRAGTIVDAKGNVIVSSTGVFTYSRRSAPFGFNGAYFYAGAEYRF